MLQTLFQLRRNDDQESDNESQKGARDLHGCESAVTSGITARRSRQRRACSRDASPRLPYRRGYRCQSGQFTLAARHCFPDADIISFEPLPEPAAVFRRVFARDNATVLHEAAIGPAPEHGTMHVSAQNDSSSLLPISSLQGEIFPGTDEIATVNVRVAPLDTFLAEDDIRGPALLKLDVQGFELSALRGCEPLLPSFDAVYCECSFVELYSGQKMAADVIDWLSAKGFRIKGIYNPSYDNVGKSVQADFLFRREGEVGIS